MNAQIINKPLLLEQLPTLVYSNEGYIIIKQVSADEIDLVCIDPINVEKLIKALRSAVKEMEA